MNVTIDRATWACGYTKGHPEGSRLLDDHGNRCALGFVLQAAQIDDSRYLNRFFISEPFTNTDPRDIPREIHLLRTGTFHFPNSTDRATLLMRIMSLNDGVMPAERRETLLTEAFALAEIQITFTGEYPETIE